MAQTRLSPNCWASQRRRQRKTAHPRPKDGGCFFFHTVWVLKRRFKLSVENDACRALYVHGEYNRQKDIPNHRRQHHAISTHDLR
jgi:hypothetical protein